MTHSGDDGFTLIDTLIAILIMGTTIVALVTALTGLIYSTQAHRGNAVAEDVTRSFTEALTAKAMFSTTLTQSVAPTDTTVTVADASGFASSKYLNVDNEMMLIVSANGKAITVGRIADDNLAHAVGAPVTAAFRCPAASELSPAVGSWSSPTGVTAQVSAISYWNPASNNFENADTCPGTYDNRCLHADGSTGAIDVWCDSGLELVTISVDTSGDQQYKGVTAVTQTLVRRGGP